MSLRSNITYDTSDGSTQQGIPLHIVLHVFTVTGKNAMQNMGSSNSNIKNTSANVCSPLRGARVDL
jgi:hypothetical protein